MTIGERLNKIRYAEGWTIPELTRQLSAKAGHEISQKAVEHWVYDRRIPSTDTMGAVMALIDEHMLCKRCREKVAG